MEKVIKITTIDEEFEKAKVKPFFRTRKGKMERVKGFERNYTHGFNFLKPSEGGPDIRRSDIASANKAFERAGLRAKAELTHSIYVGHHLVKLDAETKRDSQRAKMILKQDFGIDID